MADDVDRAVDKFRKDGHTRNMSSNEHHAWQRALREQSQRGSDARAYQSGNKK